METEKAKKTRRKKAEKSGTKEGVKEKRVNARKKANEEKEKKQREEALNLHRQLKAHGLVMFDGVAVDFHRNRPAVIFDPETETLSVVAREDLPRFIVEQGIRRVLIDAMFPKRSPIIAELLRHEIEVYVLRRPTALSGFKAMVQRRYKDVQIPQKNDFVDAVCLIYTWPKFHRKIDLRYVECWQVMCEWRQAYALYVKVLQELSASSNPEKLPVTLDEGKLIEAARSFVETMERHFPGIRRVFEKIRIPDDDVIAQALCCEIALETYHIEKVSDVLRKVGIGIQSVAKKKVRKKTEDKQTENRPKRKVFQYDGKLLFAANQLAVKLFHLNPKREPEKVMLKTKKLLEDIWRCSRELQLTKESGRVGEALGVSGPSRIERERTF
jgi:predicted transposase YbfD/YdcC